MNIGLFGGTFDPIHLGHTALARGAAESFDLGRVYFVPSNLPPHKAEPAASFVHRYAMVSLATRDENLFVPSLLEAPGETTPVPSKKKDSAPRPNYTIDTVRRLKSTLKKADRLFLLIGIDAFKDIAKWYQAEELFGECEFVVASRPGYSLADIANFLPSIFRPHASVTKPFVNHPAKGELRLPGVTIRLLDKLNEPVSASAIRQARAARKPLTKFLDPAVADYIKKEGLYQVGLPSVSK
jgi:nicotinate-nucleotide adenylyltransferase